MGATVLFPGDTGFGMNYQDVLAARGEEPVLRTRGRDYMVSAFIGILSTADLTIANLETTISDIFPSPYANKKPYFSYSDITEAPRKLAELGFDLVSLGNNHAFDFGAPGLAQTRDLLGAVGIETCGAGKDAVEAARPHVARLSLSDRDAHVAVFCGMEHREAYDGEYDYYAGSDKAGVNPVAPERIARGVEVLRRAYEDLIIVAFPNRARRPVLL